MLFQIIKQICTFLVIFLISATQSLADENNIFKEIFKMYLPATGNYKVMPADVSKAIRFFDNDSFPYYNITYLIDYDHTYQGITLINNLIKDSPTKEKITYAFHLGVYNDTPFFEVDIYSKNVIMASKTTPNIEILLATQNILKNDIIFYRTNILQCREHHVFSQEPYLTDSENYWENRIIFKADDNFVFNIISSPKITLKFTLGNNNISLILNNKNISNLRRFYQQVFKNAKQIPQNLEK